MKAQHTPALWRIEINDTGFRITHSDSGLRSHVATLHEAALCEEHGDTFANAKLIASAPDMFDALQAIVDAYGDRDTLLIAQCKAALAKAKGEA